MPYQAIVAECGLVGVIRWFVAVAKVARRTKWDEGLPDREMATGNGLNGDDEMPVCRLKSLVSRMNAVRVQLEKEQMKRLPRAFRLVRAKTVLLRLQIEIQRLAVHAGRVSSQLALGHAEFQNEDRRLQPASVSNNRGLR